jgi:exoribonuclease R
LKAALAGAPLPYTIPELTELAKHCTDQEDAATKVERQVNKSAAALLLSGKIGQQFDAIVTGAADKGTWVRLLQPPTEGRLMLGFQGPQSGRPRSRQTHPHRCPARFHRFRPRLTLGRIAARAVPIRRSCSIPSA